MSNAQNTFSVTFEDGRFRAHRVTFRREHVGQFPTMVKLERLDNNGREEYWTLYRASCHGEMSTIVKNEIKKASELVRWQA